MSKNTTKTKAKIIDGRQQAAIIHAQTQKEIKKIIATGSPAPKLAIILIGEHTASEIYVRNKIFAAGKIGMRAELVRYKTNISNQELLAQIGQLNNDTDIAGIIVQLPLPDHIETRAVINAISPKKDVDGFHPINLGSLYSGVGEAFIACTALGCLRLIESIGEDLTGKHVVIVGRSNIVGRPLAALLLRNDATVTIAHSKTKNLKDLTLKADIVVSAVGNPKFLTADYFNQNAIVIDVGINRVEYEDKCEIVGDIDFDSVAMRVRYISPVPGGVGPMTIAYLLANCVRAYKLQHSDFAT